MLLLLFHFILFFCYFTTKFALMEQDVPEVSDVRSEMTLCSLVGAPGQVLLDVSDVL